MKISHNWLKDYLPLSVSAKDLGQHLLSLGFEVSSYERRGPAFSGVITAQILEISKHPNADRLSLCTVFDGSRKLSIVCGAQNIKVGQKVPLAKIGATLPGGRVLTPAKIRGVESQGMICSAGELGVSGSDNGGILVLDDKTEVGLDFAAKLGGSDDVLDVEITPNRPDCLSHLGLARELAAYFRLPLTLTPAPAPAAHDPCIPVEVENASACPRYMGRVFSGLQVGPSPAWLADRLLAVGLRPINNLVDISNYILMDMGQPLHAFDLDKLEGGRIVVRPAKPGEKLKTLDEKEYALSPDILVIADSKKPVAIAGVMGGLDSAVSLKTTRAFLESAHFAPAAVRKASQTLRLRSDSSYRFERGTDIAAVELAANRAAELILKLCGPKAKASSASDIGRKTAEFTQVKVTAQRVNDILGSRLEAPVVAQTLKRISAGFAQEGETLVFTPPSYRRDLATAWDLAEEVGRLVGYDGIPARTPAFSLKPARLTKAEALSERLRKRLAALGLLEAYNYDFLPERLITQARIPPADLPRLSNPLSEDWAVLRPTLLIGLLENARANLNRGASSVRLFELGKIYAKAPSGVNENLRAAGVLLGPVAPAFWKSGRTPDNDFHDTKGLIEDILSGLPDIKWAPAKNAPAAASDPLFHTVSTLKVTAQSVLLGTVGLLHPQAARAWGLERENATIFDLDLDLLCHLEPAKIAFKPLSPFPSSKRDLSIVLVRGRLYAEVEAAIRGCRIAELQELELIDVFEGPAIGADKKSLTLRLTFGREDRTLKDAEVNAAVDKVLSALKARLGAVLRA